MDKLKVHVGMILTIAISLSLAMPVIMAVVPAEDSETQYYMVQFDELPSSQLRSSMENSGLEFQGYYQDGAYLVKVNNQPSENSLLMNYAANMEPYTSEMKISQQVRGIDGQIDVKILLHDGVDVQATVGQLETMGVAIRQVNTDSVNHIRCTMNYQDIVQVSEFEDIGIIDLDSEPVAFMDLITSNTFMGHDTTQSFGFTGDGILAEVQDNGIDIGHPDLANVIYTDGSVSDDDHGTCTSGIVFGNGAGDMKALGIAYESVGVFSDWGTGRATSINNLWDGTFNEGNSILNGVVQSNSWSSGTQDGLYQLNAAAVDAAVYDNPKVLSLWANGNGNDGTNEGELSEDACAKNVMGIGAIFHKDTANMADDEWILQSQGNTPSRGPAADGRQKPEMCAPFDWTYTVDNRVGGYASGDYVDDFGGTSGATPIVAGSAVIAYDMWEENFFETNPGRDLAYSSTIKALLVANAYQYDLSDATRNEQGWGTPDMEYMYNLGADYHQIDEYPQALDSGDSYSRQIYSDGINPLKISLAWIDPAAPGTTNAARALINNLDLKVVSPGGVTYYGNNGMWTSLWTASGTGNNQWGADYRDDLNNLENMFVQNPQSGIWTIEVSGRTGDVAQGPQDFSLVASGAKEPITSMGMILLDKGNYTGEDTALIQVMDLDLNTNTNAVQTVTINIDSDTEPAGENILLTETGDDTSTFEGTVVLSATNGVGILQVSHNDIVTATYNDADDGSGSATVTAIALVDAGALSPIIQEVDWWGPVNVGETTLETRYLRSDSQTVNTVTGDIIGTTNSATDDTASISGGRTSVYTGIRVYVVDSGGGSTELTSGTAVAQTARTGDGSGTITGTWTPPVTSISTTDSVVVELYADLFANPTTLRQTFTTEQLGATELTDNQWTVQYWSQRDRTSQGGSYIAWGDASHENHIEGFQYTNSIPSNPLLHNTLNWTLSGDDGAGANDIIQYNIYRANNPSGPWIAGAIIDTAPPGTDTYVDIDSGNSDGTQWWYVIRAEDALGNEDGNSVAVPEPGAPTLSAYDIPIPGTIGARNDWVFVSFPYVMSGPIQNILDDAIHGGGGTTWSVAKWYNPLTPADPWMTYRVGSNINDLVNIDNTMGVWIKLTASDGVLSTGLTGDYSAAPVNINLYTGWNMVSYPSASNMLASTALAGASADMVAYYDDAAPYDITDAAPGTVTFSEGKAYWVHVTADSTWSVNL